jgi:S-adenosylhomocysteine hydrolase
VNDRHAPPAGPRRAAVDDQAIPGPLPFLDAIVDHHGQERPFAGWTALLIQHQLGSQVRMARALLDLGIAPARMYWIDIPYTANGTVHAALLALGIPEDNFAPSYYNLELKYAAYQHERVQAMALRLAKTLRPTDHLLVLDDGAYFLEALTCIGAAPPDVRIVEQTTRGMIKLRQDATLRQRAASVVTVNVAESGPKKTIEGGQIGAVVCDQLVARLGDKTRGGASPRCLVLGYGSIGRNVARSLQERLGVAAGQIQVNDENQDARGRALADRHPLWTRDDNDGQPFDIVIGCSGTTSFTVSDRIFLEDGAVLASASSGSAELSREAFIELADSHPGHDIYVQDRATLATRSVHSDILLHLVDRDVRFLNGGFPVNFDGRVNCVAPHLIQATHALQVGAAVEAVRATRKGILPPSQELCDWIVQRFEEQERAFAQG